MLNVLARVMTLSESRSSAKPLLQQLHWLPINGFPLSSIFYYAQKQQIKSNTHVGNTVKILKTTQYTIL